MKVLKFGGSVLKNSADIKNITNIILESSKQEDKIIAVFSAFYGITDKLITLGEITANEENYNQKLQEIKDFHINIANELKLKTEAILQVEKLFKKIENTLLIIADRKKIFNDTKDYLISFGERLSNFIVFSYISQQADAIQISPCEMIKTDSNFGCAKVDLVKSNECIQNKIKNTKEKIVICAGFFGADSNDNITTIGRNGSDYSASIIAGALKVKQLEIWKDIDGLFTADPKIVKNVKFIKTISYQEMAELSSLGNKVLHINAIAPCIKNNIPIILRNCYNTSCDGTLIGNKEAKNYCINGIAKCDNVEIVKLKLGEYIDMTEFSIKLQNIIKVIEDGVITISQNIKQKQISILMLKTKTTQFNEMLDNLFKHEIKNEEFTIEKWSNKAMISVVGEDFLQSVGLAGNIFNALKKNNISVDAIQDDFSSTRISFVCDTNEANKIICLLHDELVN